MEIRPFLILVFLCSQVSAYTLTFGVYDYNTQNPIEGANISVYHADLSPPDQHYFIYTNADGIAEEYNDDLEHWYNITKPGYFSQLNGFVNVTEDSQVLAYLIPISEDGIVRVKVGDMTFCDGREYCLFYADNMRLQGCYQLNETPHFLNNNAYVVRPNLCKSDALISASSFKKSVDRYGSYIWPILAFVVILSMLITGVFYGFIKRRRR